MTQTPPVSGPDEAPAGRVLTKTAIHSSNLSSRRRPAFNTALEDILANYVSTVQMVRIVALAGITT